MKKTTFVFGLIKKDQNTTRKPSSLIIDKLGSQEAPAPAS